jgi:hypothetical protein
MESLSAGHTDTLGNTSTYLKVLAGDFGGTIAAATGVSEAERYLRSKVGDRSRLVGTKELLTTTVLASLALAIASIWPNNATTTQPESRVDVTATIGCLYTAQEGDTLWSIYDYRTGQHPSTPLWLEIRSKNDDKLAKGDLVTIPPSLCKPTDLDLGSRGDNEAGPDGPMSSN